MKREFMRIIDEKRMEEQMMKLIGMKKHFGTVD